MTTEPKKRDPFSDWRTAVGTRQYCGELELTIPIDRDNYFTITADPDTVAMVPVVLRQLLSQPEPEGPTLDDIVELCADHEFMLGVEGANEEESAKGILEIVRVVLARCSRPRPAGAGERAALGAGQLVSNADEFDGFFLGPDDIEAQSAGKVKA